MVELKPGDVFCTKNPQGLGRVICFAESLRSADGEATYGHSGIIIDSNGTTLEAVWHISRQNLFDAYKGNQVMIARWSGMTLTAFLKGWDSVKGEIGRDYPYYRLLMHLLGLAKWIHFQTPVCSELTEKFLINAGAATLGGKNWWGLTPDNLADEWRISRHFEIIYEGTL